MFCRSRSIRRSSPAPKRAVPNHSGANYERAYHGILKRPSSSSSTMECDPVGGWSAHHEGAGTRTELPPAHRLVLSGSRPIPVIAPAARIPAASLGAKPAPMALNASSPSSPDGGFSPIWELQLRRQARLVMTGGFNSSVLRPSPPAAPRSRTPMPEITARSMPTSPISHAAARPTTRFMRRVTFWRCNVPVGGVGYLNGRRFVAFPLANHRRLSME